MLINTATANALDAIADRAKDVFNAYTPGSRSAHGEVGKADAHARFVLDPLSAAPPADAYFLTTDERGRTVYTRGGGFSLRDGALIGSNGRPMLGYTSPNGTLCEMRVDAVDLALGRANNVRVEADGTLAYTRTSIDPRTGARENVRVVAGQLALARFPAATQLTTVDTDHAAAPPGVIPHVGRPADGNFAALAPMHQTPSGIDIDQSLARLEDAYMAFDAIAAAHKAQGSLGKTAMDLLK